jgi:hypothetical protein
LQWPKQVRSTKNQKCFLPLHSWTICIAYHFMACSAQMLVDHREMA